jgi:hypothetical protein
VEKTESLIGRLAPGLQASRLKLPQFVRHPNDFAVKPSNLRLLVYLGLSVDEAIGLIWQVGQYVDVWPKFEALPKNRRLPSIYPQNLRRGDFELLDDVPSLSVFYFYARIWFGAPEQEIVRDFATWLRKQRASLRLPRWGHKVRNMENFTRDLVIAVLSEDKNWSAAEIDIQLKFMGLPSIEGREKKTKAKDVRRKIVWNIRSLLKTTRSRRSVIGQQQ